MSDKVSNVEPAKGVVIPRSALKTLGTLAFLLVMLVGGIAIVWAWWTETGLPLPSGVVHINMVGGIAGILAAAIGAVLLPLIGLLLFVGEKLIVASDRLQIVQMGKVVTQIPYRNIANMLLGNDEGVEFIGIDLHDLDDSDTFASGCNFQSSKTSDGWHFRLLGGYQKGLAEIHQLLLDQMRDKGEA